MRVVLSLLISLVLAASGLSAATPTLAHDRENRLTSIGSWWSAEYRADGLRAWKQVGSTKTYFLYDQGEPVIEMNASGTVIAFNAFGPDGLVGRKVG